MTKLFMPFRYFFMCKDDDCGFVFTTIHDTDTHPEGCPNCLGTNIDYAPNAKREEYIEILRKRLDEMKGEE